jgi:hypothetical protein
MSNFQSLVEKLAEFQRRYAKIKTEFAALDRLFEDDPSIHLPRPAEQMPLATDDGVKQVVKFLKDAGRAVPPVEIAAGIKQPFNHTQRLLMMATKLGFLLRVGAGLYQVVDAVKEA